MILKKGVARSPLAGNFVSQQLRLLFSSSQPPVLLTPHYLVSSKAPVDAGAPAHATYKSFSPGTAPQDSFRLFQEERVLTEFKESVVQVWPGPGRFAGHGQHGTTNEEYAKTLPGRPFEMPDGWNQMFGAERYRAAEGMFDAKMALTVCHIGLSINLEKFIRLITYPGLRKSSPATRPNPPRPHSIIP